jgi:hypothetical protein
MELLIQDTTFPSKLNPLRGILLYLLKYIYYSLNSYMFLYNEYKQMYKYKECMVAQTQKTN